MTNPPGDAPTKSCACTGVRWCADCRDPLIRRHYRMDDPVRIPDLLSRKPRDPGSNPNLGDALHHFDIDLQSAPSCPAFQGVHVFREFFSADEADRLLQQIEEAAFVPAQSGKWKQHYGPRINFNKQKINASLFQGLPDYARRIESRLRILAGHDRPGRPADLRALRTALEAFECTDAFVLRYFERNASNLDFHRDDTFAYGEAILDISLESDCVLTFLERPKSDRPTNRVQCVRVPLPARSLAAVYGSARFAWDHAILAYDIAGRRTSVTLRTLTETLLNSDAGKHVLDIIRGDESPA